MIMTGENDFLNLFFRNLNSFKRNGESIINIIISLLEFVKFLNKFSLFYSIKLY